MIIVELSKGARLEELVELHELEHFVFALEFKHYLSLLVNVLENQINAVAFCLRIMYGCMAKTEQLGLWDTVLREIELADQALIVLQNLND